MNLRHNILNQIEQSIAKEKLTILNVCYLMQSIRILLEIDNNKFKYKVTNHYCNWLLHKELDKSISPEIIQYVADSFANFSTKNDLIKKVSNAISLKTFVEEIKEILWLNLPNKQIITKIDKDEYWLVFIRMILSQLLFRPLKLNIEHIKIDNFEFTIYGIQIVSIKEKYNLELLSKELQEKNKKLIIDIALFC